MGRGLVDVRRHPEARAAFERSAVFYDQAGEAKSAADCRQLASDLVTRLAADFDAAAGRGVREVLAPQDPLDRAKSLTRLLREVGNTGDRFEAARIGEDAARVLRDIGYPDPEHAFDAAVDRWIETAAASCAGNALFARVCEIAERWAAILGARTSARLASDPTGSARAERTLRGLASSRASSRSRRTRPRTRPRAGSRCGRRMRPHALAATSRIDDSMRKLDALAALDDALQRVRVACNEGASEALVEKAAALRAQAEQLASPLHVARALIEEAYVLLALRQFDGVPALCKQAVRDAARGPAGAPVRIRHRIRARALSHGHRLRGPRAGGGQASTRRSSRFASP